MAASPIRFAMIGTGWRARFFLRIARARPDLFQVTGIAGNTIDKTRNLALEFNIPVIPDWRSLLRNGAAPGAPEYVIVSVPRTISPEMLRAFAAANIPVLCETPPAGDLPGLLALWGDLGPRARIQVAEQYVFQPLHTARLTWLHAGLLGERSQAQVSVAHGYHGLNLMRRYLDIGYEDAAITALRFVSPVIAGGGRGGPPEAEVLRDSEQDLVWLNFGGKLGVFDFTQDQYFSAIRAPRLLVRGARGELLNEEAVYLHDHATPLRVRFERHEGGAGGNLDGKYLKGIQAGAEWPYRNPFAPAELSDDEIAVATCMALMGDYARGGPSFYSLAEACQDTYLALMVTRALEEGPQHTERQPWADG